MIDPGDYQNIVCLLAEAKGLLASTSTSLSSMSTVMNSVVSTQSTAELKGDLLTTQGQIALYTLEDEPFVSAFVQALQSHVAKHYGSVAQFLTDNGISVPLYVATISAGVGFTIPPARIGDCPS